MLAHFNSVNHKTVSDAKHEFKGALACKDLVQALDDVEELGELQRTQLLGERNLRPTGESARMYITYVGMFPIICMRHGLLNILPALYLGFCSASCVRARI